MRVDIDFGICGMTPNLRLNVEFADQRCRIYQLALTRGVNVEFFSPFCLLRVKVEIAGQCRFFGITLNYVIPGNWT